MEVICLQDEAFYALVDKVVSHVKEKNNIKQDKWVSGEEAIGMLRITSKTTLQKMRDTGAIRFSQPEKKLIGIVWRRTQYNVNDGSCSP